MAEGDDVNKIIENFLNKSGKEKISIVILIGVLLLVIIIPVGGDKDESESNTQANNTNEIMHDTIFDYETYMENKLEKILRSVDGVGEVKAVVTIKTSEENVLAKDSENSESVIQETDTTGTVRLQENNSTKDTYIYYDTENGNQPYIVSKNMPQIEGVVIVAKGGGDGNVAAVITSAVGALLDLPAHKIKVLKMS